MPSGVSSFNLKMNTWTKTLGGPGDTSNSDDYPAGVWDANGVRVPPHTVIPGGEYVSVGGPANGPLPKDAPSMPAQVDAANAANAYDQGTLYRAQAAAATKNADTAAQTLQSTNTRNDQLHQEVLASQGLTQQQITNTYNTDKAKYGIDKANLLLNARQAAAKSLIDSANFSLNQNAQNAQARQTVASQQLDALKMLSARQGPQDWTRWDYITGMGGNQPKPMDSKTYSPLDMIAASYQPSNIAAPAGFDASGIDAGSFPDAGTIQPAAGTGAGGASVPTMANPGQPSTNFHPAGEPATIAPQAGGGGIDGGSMSGNWQPTVAGIPGQQAVPMAGGGTTGGAAVVGDQKSGKPTKHEEIAYAANNPKTGIAELHVIPHHMLAGLIDHATGRTGGIVMHANKVPKGMDHILPRAAEGGTFDGSDVGGNPQGDAQPDNGQVPQYEANAFDQQRGGRWQNDQMNGDSSGVLQYRPQQPMTAPSRAPQQDIMAGGDYRAGMLNQTMENRNVSQMGAYANAAQAAAGQGGGQTAPGYQIPQSTGETAQPTIQPQTGLNTSPINVQGGVNFGGTAAPPPQALGPAGYDPYRITQNQYDATTMNNSPVLRMIRGQQPVYGFQGQGDYQPGIQSQGITNLPTNLNYADLMRMDPNRIAMLKGVYDNPETGESWDSIFNAAKMAAPRTSNIGVARAR